MAGRKLSAKTEEEVVFLEHVITEITHLKAKTEEYAGSKKGEDIVAGIIRQLTQIRQRAMIKNLGPIADAAGILAVAAGRGSPVQRARVLREGLVTYEQNVERTMKALIGADAREKAEAQKVIEARKAADAAQNPAPSGTAE
jgi:hypothetical protein